MSLLNSSPDNRSQITLNRPARNPNSTSNHFARELIARSPKRPAQRASIVTVDTTQEPSESSEEPTESRVATQAIEATLETTDASEPEPLQPLNPLFRLVIVVSAAFLLTVLIMLASVFSDGKSPVFVWFNQNAVMLIIVEVALVIVASVAAMAFDKSASADDEIAAEDE